MKKKVITVSTLFLLLLVLFLVSGCDDFSLIDVLANDISIIPGEITLNLDETIEFEVSAGISPFVFTEVGDGILPDGIYTAPAVAGSVTISVQDDRNRTAEAYVTVVDAVNILPEIISTGIGGVVQFTISGGTEPYDVDLDPGLGTYDTGTDIYTAGSKAGLEIIKITDFDGQIAEALVTIIDTVNLMIIPEVAEVLAGEIFTFSASGGSGTYNFSTEPASGDGSINLTNGRYTAPASPFTGTETIRVTDSDSATSDAIIYIVDKLLTINPSIALTLYVGDEFTFSASNGILPYNFSLLPGYETAGSINGTTGLFTALAKDNRVTVIVTDANGNTSTCRVKIKS